MCGLNHNSPAVAKRGQPPLLVPHANINWSMTSIILSCPGCRRSCVNKTWLSIVLTSISQSPRETRAVTTRNECETSAAYKLSHCHCSQIHYLSTEASSSFSDNTTIIIIGRAIIFPFIILSPLLSSIHRAPLSISPRLHAVYKYQSHYNSSAFSHWNANFSFMFHLCSSTASDYV